MEGAIVGRERELAAVAALLDAADGGCAALVLEGEAGIGKTTVWLAGIDRAQALGYRVLSCRPAEIEASLPFVSLGDLLEPVLDEGMPGLAPAQRRALETALARVEPTEAFDRLAVSRATLALLRELAGRQPVLLAVDDVQWLDPASAAVVAFATRRLGDA